MIITQDFVDGVSQGKQFFSEIHGALKEVVARRELQLFVDRCGCEWHLHPGMNEPVRANAEHGCDDCPF